MTTFYTKATKGVLNAQGAVQLANAALLGGRVKALVGVVDMAVETILSGDELIIGELPKGAVPIVGLINSPTLGSSTVAIGITGSTGKYRAAATFTAAAPTLFGVAAALGEPLAAAERIRATIAAANMPTSGKLEIVIFYTQIDGG